MLGRSGVHSGAEEPGGAAGGSPVVTRGGGAPCFLWEDVVACLNVFTGRRGIEPLLREEPQLYPFLPGRGQSCKSSGGRELEVGLSTVISVPPAVKTHTIVGAGWGAYVYVQRGDRESGRLLMLH